MNKNILLLIGAFALGIILTLVLTGGGSAEKLGAYIPGAITHTQSQFDALGGFSTNGNVDVTSSSLLIAPQGGNVLSLVVSTTLTGAQLCGATTILFNTTTASTLTLPAPAGVAVPNCLSSNGAFQDFTIINNGGGGALTVAAYTGDTIVKGFNPSSTLVMAAGQVANLKALRETSSTILYTYGLMQ